MSDSDLSQEHRELGVGGEKYSEHAGTDTHSLHGHGFCPFLNIRHECSVTKDATEQRLML